MIDESTTDVSELAPDDRITVDPPPPDPLDTLRAALANCADLCVQLLQRLDLGERRFNRIEEHARRDRRRLEKIEQHLGIQAAE